MTYPQAPDGDRRAAGNPSARLTPGDLALLAETASEVSKACPWVAIDADDADRPAVEDLVDRGLMAATSDLAAITLAGVLALSRHDRPLARQALAGLRRNVAEGEVLPWDI